MEVLCNAIDPTTNIRPAKGRTLSGLQAVQDRRIAERKVKLEAARAKAKADQPVMSWLPERGEGGDAYHERMRRQKAQLTSAD